jgi:hypothetical protein
MLNNPYVLSGLLALVSTVVLYLLSRNDEKTPSWKLYLRHLVIVGIVLVSIDFIKPYVMSGGGSSMNNAVQPDVNLGQPDF